MQLTQFLVAIGTIVMPLGLIGIFVGSIFDPEMGEKSYGVVNPNKNEMDYYPFHFAAGIRDGVFGIIGLLLRFKYPEILLEFYIILILIPVGDLAVVKHYDGSFMDGICHFIGAIATEENRLRKSNKLKHV